MEKDVNNNDYDNIVKNFEEREIDEDFFWNTNYYGADGIDSGYSELEEEYDFMNPENNPFLDEDYLKREQEKQEVINGVESYDKELYFNEIDDLFLKDIKYNQIGDFKHFNYAEYIEEYQMEDIHDEIYRLYSIELFNDKKELNKLMFQLIIADKSLEKANKTVSEYIKEWLCAFNSIEVNNVMSFKDENPQLGHLNASIKVSLSRMWPIYMQNAGTSTAVNNVFQVYLFNFFNEVRKMGIFKERINNDLIREIHYNKLVSMRNGIDVKIPVKYIQESSGRHIWDYEYLLSPVQNLDQKNKLKINIPILKKNIEKPEFPGEPNVLSNFSLNRYEVLHQKYWIITTLLRPLINIIREKYDNICIYKDIFEITQICRMQEESRMTYTEVDYKSTFTELETFPSIVSTLDCRVSDLKPEFKDNIKSYILKTKKQLEYLDSSENSDKNNSREVLFRIYINLLSVYNYILYLDFNEKELINELYRIERIREGIRHQLMYYNLCMRGNILDLIDVIGSVESCNQKEIFKYKYTLDGFDFRERDGSDVYNDVVLAIKDNPKESELDEFSDYIERIENMFVNID